jgi:exodeoxyribonuclease VII small subunit
MENSTPDEWTFEEALVELERVVRALEDGQLSLEESLADYEKGVGLIKRCYNQLRQAEQRILLLTGVEESGEPILQPFQHEATAATRTEALRRGRKKDDAV